MDEIAEVSHAHKDVAFGFLEWTVSMGGCAVIAEGDALGSIVILFHIRIHY
jgi:hypothetical protein